MNSKLIVGIDLGTTTSSVGRFDGQNLELMPIYFDNKEYNYMPSAVYYENDGSSLYGFEALAKSDNALISFKRFIGLSEINDPLSKYKNLIIENSCINFLINDKHISPIKASADLLRHLKSKAEIYFKANLAGAVITVPAYFSHAQRDATRRAAIAANIKVLKLLSEPTAAGIAYGIKKDGIYGIYDLGGGTFDFSVIDIKDNNFRVIETTGDTTLGGDDIDHLIINHYQENKKLIINKNEAKLLKENVLSPYDLELVAKPLIYKTLDLLEESISTLEDKSIDSIILVGGSTRMPFIKTYIKNRFNIKVQNTDNPESMVVKGAAIHANMLHKSSNLTLIDVLPISLGIEVMGGLFEKIILKNTPIPVSASSMFSTMINNQSNISINIFQGERLEVSNCSLIAKLELRDIPAYPAGYPKIMVLFILDSDGTLKVNVKEERSGEEITADLEPIYTINDEDSEFILKDQLYNASSDSIKIELIRKITKVKQSAQLVSDALIAEPDLIDATSTNILKKIISSINSLSYDKNIYTYDDLISIDKLSNSLNNASEEFMKLRMLNALNARCLK